MGRGRHDAQVGADRARGRAVHHHDRGQPDRHRDRAVLDATQPRQSMNELRAAIDLRQRRTWRTTKNALMLSLLGLAVVIVALPLAHIVYSVTLKGASVVFKAFPAFFTSEIPVVS